MQTKRFKPLLDRLFWCTLLPTEILVLGLTVALGILEPGTLFWMAPVSLFVTYFLLTPLFGYAELRESVLFIRYGFILKREIPYKKIRKIEMKRSIISESMLSLKNALSHVEIRYNSFDVTAVSVKHNEEFMSELLERINAK